MIDETTINFSELAQTTILCPRCEAQRGEVNLLFVYHVAKTLEPDAITTYLVCPCGYSEQE